MAALTVGELVAYAQIDRKDFQAGTRDIASGMRTIQSETTSSMRSMETSVTRSLSEIEQSIRDGLDPAAAIADLDRLEAEVDSAFADMLAEADNFAAELDAEIDQAFAQMDDDARESGRRAGRELVDGLEDGLSEAERVARDAGRESGREFGDGVEDGGGGSGGGGRMAGIGAGLIGSLKMGALGLAAGAGAAIGAALMGGLEGALDAQKAKQKLLAQLGATGPEMKKLGTVAGQVYADAYGESMSDVTTAIKSLVQNVDGMGQASEKTLGDMTKRAMDVATVMDEDVASVTEAVSQILRNKLAPNAEAAFDVLVKGTQMGGDKAQDLLDTFVEYSTQFRELGLDAQTAMGLMSQGLKAGARDADTVADALKEFAIRAKDGSDTSRDAFTSIGLNADSMFQTFAKGGPNAKAALGEVLDRIRDIKDPVEQDAVAVALFGTKAEDLQDALLALDPTSATTLLGDFGGAAKKAGDTLNDTASSKLTAFKRGVEENVVNFLGGTVLPKLEEFGDAFSRGWDLSPVGDKIESWAGRLGGIWDSIVTDVQEWVADNQETIDGWVAKFETGFGHVSAIVEDVLTGIEEFWAEWGDEILVGLGLLVDTFLNAWNLFWGLVEGAVDIAKGLLTGDFESLKEGLTKIWDSIWEWCENTVSDGLKAIGGFVGTSWEDLKSKTGEAWENFKKKVSDGINDAVAWVKGLPGKIKTGLGNLGSLLLQAGKDLIQGMINGIKAKAGELVNSARGVVDDAVRGAKNLLGIKSPSTVFEDIGENSVLGFIGGLVNKGKDLAGQAWNTFSDVVTQAKTATGTGGSGGGAARPSSSMHEIGKLTVKGLIDGLTSEKGKAVDVVKDLIAQIKDAFKSQPDVADGLVAFVSKGNDSLLSLAKQREELVARLAAAKDMAKSVAGDAKEWASITGLTEEELEQGDISGSLKDRAQAIKDFANDIKRLAERGLNKETLRQIIEAGVDGGASIAEMLVGAPGSEIKAINKAQAQIDKMSKQLGKNGADALYDVGKKAGEGYLKGLQDSLAKLDKEMAKIVSALVKAIKRELKIKSPSQVFAEIGVQTVAGLAQGIVDAKDQAIAATATLAQGVIAGARGALGGIGGRIAGDMGPSNAMFDVGSGGSLEDLQRSAAAKRGWGPGAAGGAPVINVDMSGSVIREEADIPKVVKGFGMEYGLRAPAYS